MHIGTRNIRQIVCNVCRHREVQYCVCHLHWTGRSSNSPGQSKRGLCISVTDFCIGSVFGVHIVHELAFVSVRFCRNEVFHVSSDE